MNCPDAQSAKTESVQAEFARLGWRLILRSLIVVRKPRLNLSADVEEELSILGAESEAPILQLPPNIVALQLPARGRIRHDFAHDLSDFCRPLLREPTVTLRVPKRGQLAPHHGRRDRLFLREYAQLGIQSLSRGDHP